MIWFRGGRIVREHLPISCLSLGENDQIAPNVASSLESFWSNMYTHGIHNFNHSNRTDQIAINLTQVLDLFPNLFKRPDLIQTLPHSKPPYPKYLEHNIAIQSRLERKTIRCWIFTSSQPTMIDVGR
ncbi:phage-like protein [Acinetobacter baumannii]|nr:phage-like protein [Acinetobacter baumannii]